jgi:polyisoprenoid-binding protein YceI
VALATGQAHGDVMSFKLLPNYSRATFKSDAPLETFVGNTAAEGVDGTLTLDPARPQAATGSVKVDMSLVRTGIDKRDADMRSKNYLDTEVEANRWVTFEIKGVEISGPLEPGKAVPAKVKGILTVKQKPVERIVDATVTWIKLAPEEVEAQKRFGFTADNIKVRARFATTFTDHGLKIPAILFYKVSNDIQLETDLTFVRQ